MRENRPMNDMTGQTGIAKKVCHGFAALCVAGTLTVTAMPLASPAAAESQPWLALGSKRNTDYTYGKFEGDKEKTGSYDERIWIFKLDDANYTDGDWYRVDMSIGSLISRYRINGVCGWITDKVTAGFHLKSPGGDIVDYGPQTTISSRATGYSVGTKLDKFGPKVTAAYSISQEVPDEGIKVWFDTVGEKLQWQAKLGDCGIKEGTTGSAIGFRDPPQISRNSYSLNPSVMVVVPEGAKLQFSTTVDDFDNGFVQTKAKIKSDFPSNKVIKRKTIYTFSYDVSCDSTSCSINRKVNNTIK